jgi:hypothetical protein
MKKGKEGIGIKAVDTKRVSIDEIKKLIDNYARTSDDVNYDLVFSPQFTKQDLHILEHYAIALNLSPLFFGSSKFVLVISKKLSLQQIMQKVIQRDPYLSRKYQIIPPFMFNDKNIDELQQLCSEKFMKVDSRRVIEIKKTSFGLHTKLVHANQGVSANQDAPKPAKKQPLLGMTKKEKKKELRLKDKHDPFKDGFKYDARSKKDKKREKAEMHRQKQKGYSERFETPIQSCQSMFAEELAKYAPEKKANKNRKRKFNKR